MKGISPLLSGVIYMVVVLTGISLVMVTLYPKINEMKTYSEIKDTLRCINNIQNALYELNYLSENSEKKIYCTLKKSTLKIESKQIIFSFPYIKYTYQHLFDDLTHTIDKGVYVYDNSTYFLLGNSMLEINISKNAQNLSGLINHIYHKNTNTLIKDKINITLNYDDALSTGNIKMYTEETGENLSYGKIYAELENNFTKTNITFILYPESEYFLIGIE